MKRNFKSFDMMYPVVRHVLPFKEKTMIFFLLRSQYYKGIQAYDILSLRFRILYFFIGSNA